ncbi:MAG: sulfite exporter TauE/SafE family protein, partial [Actinobacteria bacterium]|nr:sulfite exporter TauE/SafE family protein [Actinomycetota bacterium]
PAAPVAAGFLGGLLGTSTSLLGIPPALLLARQRIAAASFIADLAVYFVVSGTLGLAVLAAAGELEAEAGRAFLYWLPGVLVANAVGTTIGLRVPQQAFRLGTLTLAFAAGALTAATA